mmetsp:Transcript_23892/g.39511  ORF Transcript_23892/g.39511 Transcript_23892/m.39511 type:complete len:283 (+) Transcript_23892:377-1225(+)
MVRKQSATSNWVETRFLSSRPTRPYPVDCIDTSFGLIIRRGIMGARSAACFKRRCTASTSVAPGATSSSASAPSTSCARPIELHMVFGGRLHFCFTKAAVPSSGKSSCTIGLVEMTSAVSRAPPAPPSSPASSSRGINVPELMKSGNNGCRSFKVLLSNVYVSSPADVSNSMTILLRPSANASLHAAAVMLTESSKESGSGCGTPVGAGLRIAAISSSVCPAAFCAASPRADNALLVALPLTMLSARFRNTSRLLISRTVSASLEAFCLNSAASSSRELDAF